MAMENITLSLSSDLIQKARALTDEENDLQAFITDAIANEIKRRQTPDMQLDFWGTISQIQEELRSEDLEVYPDEIWGDVRDNLSEFRSPFVAMKGLITFSSGIKR